MDGDYLASLNEEQLRIILGVQQKLRALLEGDLARYKMLEDGARTLASPLPLPTEIISEIFQHCARNDLHTLDSHSAPLVLLGVCRLWRSIALSTPNLWSTLYIDLSMESEETMPELDTLALIMDSWLERAGSLPLNVSMENLPLVHAETVLRPVLNVIERHSPRIETISAQLFINHMQALCDYEMDFPKLVELDLTSDQLDESNQEYGLFLFRNAPHLRRVHLSDLCLEAVDFPREQIQEFSSRGCTAKECLGALHGLPNLPTASLQPYLIDFGRSDLSGITHTQLRRLALEENEEDISTLDEENPAPRPVHILAFLTLPALEALEISGTKIFHSAILQAFLERSSPPLRKLSFSHNDAHVCVLGSLEGAFRLLPRLEELELVSPSSGLMTRVCKLLVKEDCKFLVRLKHLTVIASQSRGKKLPAVHSWVKKVGEALVQRNWSSLETVRIVERGKFVDMDPQRMLPVLEPFVALRKSGVKVHVGTRDISAV